ncbi:alpha/beta hydrolase [Burkholderia orbicola]|uniref:Peptidase S9 prolyl oligopeptidase catalytic domain-containing protein n=2 Tax=Burkholderia orbicola TaxID=2978683 RepID=A0A0H2Y0L4_BURO1|nr:MULTISPECIES: prolyl oligopeptidase family serine peptidase [Burkholderia]EKS9839909.1 alpha/beta hydrolase [Burkholderia cepacia]ABK12706.1 conserved hypothetical protein [Burkholderia cenocepacia HI2424]AQT54957.1 dipeptidyl aminopeptidase [Burkholderia cenocepacia]MBJ9669910.1 alpha/beta hydrolase [Burkholderia cenocepacia]MBJ9729433.1 alpha/beta hydrolase [Burkholderia cenocepacia]
MRSNPAGQTMVEYFPTNYVWNLSVNIALASGGNSGEIDAVCRSLVAASTRSDDGATEAFFLSWCDLGDRLRALAEADLAAGRRLSAGAKFGRAAVYYLTGERMTHPSFEPRKAAYAKALRCFARFAELHEKNCERVEIPYRGASLAGVFVAARGDASAAAPCVVFANGLDSFKETIYGSGVQQALAARNISSLAIDQPGTGEALRVSGLTALIESEVWAGAVADYLAQRTDVDSRMLGMCAWSLGGYYAPRAVAIDKRFRLCVAWGANFNWGELQRRRLAREGDNPVPHYWDHVRWVWGKATLEEFMVFSERITLAPVIDEVTVPFLIVHGDADRQIPREYAIQQYQGAVNSPKRELKFFTAAEGGVEHCSADNVTNVRDYIADWIAETYRELGAIHVET